MKSLLSLVFITSFFSSGNIFARHCVDEISSMRQFQDMHNDAENIFWDLDYQIKKYGKDYICSLKQLDSYIEMFKEEDRIRKIAKLKVINRGMIDDEYYIPGADDFATESEVCAYSDQLYLELKPMHDLFNQYRSQRLYYNHEEHCRLHLEYITKREKKKK